MRRTPEVVFVHDRGMERGTSVLSLLNQLERERSQREEADGEPAEDADPGQHSDGLQA
jgi:ribosome-binding factor A